MTEFKVIGLIRYNVIELMPDWNWTNRDGKKLKDNKVKISGLHIDAGEPDNTLFTPNRVKAILNTILKDKYVTLENPIETVNDSDALIECKVVLNGVNIMDYFPNLTKIHD